MNTIKIKKWVNGNGILLPKVLLDMLSLKTDDELFVEFIDNKIVLSPSKKKHKTLTERFSGYTGETKQEEFWSGYPIGKEVI